MGIDVKRPAYYFEPKYIVMLLTREDWTKGTEIPPVVKGLIWIADVSKVRLLLV
jgi:hypothetical protein